MFLVYLLIIIFMCLAIYEILFKSPILFIENFELESNEHPATYKPYNIDSSNVLISQENARNIESLKGDIGEITGINSRVNEMIDMKEM